MPQPVVSNRLAGLLVFFSLGVLLPAQVESPPAVTEDDERRKAPQLYPDEATSLDRVLPIVRNRPFLKIFAPRAGFRLKSGAPVTGSGLTLGPEYFRPDLADGKVVFRASARGSIRKYELYDIEVGVPRLAGDKVFLDFLAVHRNFPHQAYYGPGPDSRESGLSRFRLEDTAYNATAGLLPFSHFKMGVTGGYLQVNTGPGTDPLLPSAETVFSPATTPGLDRQSDFLRGIAFLQYDYRDRPGGPRRGGNYIAQYGYHSDRTLGLHSFRRLDLEAQQYIPFFNERRVIALRGRTMLTDAAPGQTVPFYLQPTLGGPDDLRGFRYLRFYDNNLMAFNAEWRWEVLSGVDMALFGDAGKVFHRRADWNLSNLEGSYGFGFRFNLSNNVFARLDVGFSHEGYQIWLKFSNVF